MKQLVFRIEGMDCGDEVAVLRKEIGPLVREDANLAFDLIAGKMTVSVSDENTLSAQQIRKAVANTGMKAIPWSDSCAGGVCAVEQGFWQRIVFALGIKALFIALAIGGVATLWAAIAADMGASLLVIFNALRLLSAKQGSRPAESAPDPLLAQDLGKA